MFSVFSGSDAAVVQQVLQGRTDRFSVLVRRYHSALFGVAMSHLGNRADAEDAVQDAFLKAYASLPNLRDASRIGAWLVAITRNHSLSVIEKRRRETPLEHHDIAMDPPSVETREAHGLLWSSLQRVEEDTREILLLFYFSKKSTREIAALLDISPAAACKRLQRARDVLGRELVDTLGGELRPESAKAPTRKILAALPPVAYGAPAQASAGGLVATAVLASALPKVAAAVVAVALVGAAFVFTRSTPPEATPAPVAAEQSDEEEAPVSAPTPPEQVQADVAPLESEVSQAAPPAELPFIAPLGQGGGRISGKVVDMEGNPLPEMRVHASTGSGGSSFSAEADSQGNFVLTGVRPGHYTLQAVLKAMRGFTATPHLSVEVPQSGVLEDVRLVYPGFQDMSIAGRVLTTSGAPIAGATVDMRGGNGGEKLTAEDGGFRFENLEESDYGFFATHPNFTRNRRVIIAAAGTQDLEIVLEGVATISGRVVDTDGRPLPNAQVMLDNSRVPQSALEIYQQPGRRGVMPVNADGQFEISGAAAGAAATLVAGAPGFAPASVLLEGLKENEHRGQVVVKLQKGASLLVRVEDPEGRPLADAPVRIGKQEDYSAAAVEKHRGMMRGHVGWTDAAGELLIAGLPEGPLTLFVHATGFSPKHQQIHIGSAEGVQGEVIQLSTGASISGAVTLDGKPLLSGSISIGHVGQKGVPHAFAWIEQGRYVAKGILPGTVQIIAHAHQARGDDKLRATTQLVLSEGEEVVHDVVFSSGTASVEGFVSLDGEPGQVILQATLVDDSSGTEYSTDSRADGYYRFDGLPAGKLRLSVNLVIEGQFSAELDLLPGQVARQDFSHNRPTGSTRVLVEGAREDAEVQFYFFRNLPDFDVLDGLVLSGLEKEADFIRGLGSMREGTFSHLPTGEFTLLGIATTEWTDEALAEAQIITQTIEVVEGEEVPEVVLAF